MLTNNDCCSANTSITTSTASITTALETLLRKKTVNANTSFSSTLTTIPNDDTFNESYWMESINTDTEYSFHFCPEPDNEIPEQISLSALASPTTTTPHNVIPVTCYRETTKQWR